ncbi:sigma-70 family RNA polymerase sigma factor [Ferrimonas futtsuensis]|uniref:sigma-70 family RNA polymerase sigma factor n=1 Tax=Ferrimonas futtsuensis TaxID=364764 RepID=UPI0006858179|nr:sigma-70 family RNA polymerase sigma factor [Ferrimonas futtsuensis]
MTVSASQDDLNRRLAQAMTRVANHRDKQAYAELFRHFAGRVHAFCFTRLGDDQTAREVTQDTLLAVWQKAASFDLDKGNVSTWIYTIARNRCFDLGRQKLSRPTLVSADELYLEPTPVEDECDLQIQGEAEKRRLNELIARLPENQRQVVSLVYLKEMSHQAVAEHLNLPVGTVKSRLRLAMEKLSMRLTKGALGYE